MQDVPVLLIIYRRPEETRRVFAAIRRARPRRLFIAADGPATEEDQDACERTRAIVSEVDWPCEVTRQFNDLNHGVDVRVPSAITHAFASVERLIVLEDDCLVAPDFFRFCAEMLARFEGEPRVLHVSGECYRRRRAPSSYFFSKYALPWGWATWRRAWTHFDPRLSSWPEYKVRADFAVLFESHDERRYWGSIFDQQHAAAAEGRAPVWDYAWAYACMTHGLAVHPGANLVSNIGYGAMATHTRGEGALANRPLESLDWPLNGAPAVMRDRQADIDTFDDRFPGGILKYQRTLRHQLGRPFRWASRLLRDR